jgi:type VI protein secretion system component VasF
MGKQEKDGAARGLSNRAKVSIGVGVSAGSLALLAVIFFGYRYYMTKKSSRIGLPKMAAVSSADRSGDI